MHTPLVKSHRMSDISDIHNKLSLTYKHCNSLLLPSLWCPKISDPLSTTSKGDFITGLISEISSFYDPRVNADF